MRKVGRGMKWIICSLLLLGCTAGLDLESIEKYCGGTIYEKRPRHRLLVIQIQGEFRRIQVYQLDYDKYDVGDTIQCSH